MAEWMPLGVDDSDPTYLNLVEGIPDYLATSFWDWARVCLSKRDSSGYQTVHIGSVRQMERRLRVALPVSAHESVYTNMLRIRRAIEGAEIEIRFADYLLSEGSVNEATSLEAMLSESGSAWTVGERMGHKGLLRRVPEGSQRAAEHVMNESGHAGSRLAEAWLAAFGVSPDPSKAYSLAVKAVEDAMKPLVAPKDATTTLGKMIGQIKAQGDWSLPFQREDKAAPTAEMLVKMLKMLWAGQADRHGGDPDPALVITKEAAEAAVMLAVPLVQAFVSGAAARVDRAEH